MLKEAHISSASEKLPVETNALHVLQRGSKAFSLINSAEANLQISAWALKTKMLVQ